MPEKTGQLYNFGPFVLNTSQHLLTRDGQPVPVTPKTYALLLVLIESSGRMLTKDELMKALWPNSFVEESNLTQQVSMIRKALGQTAGKDRYITTVPGSGYRFAGVIKTSFETPPPQAASAEGPKSDLQPAQAQELGSAEPKSMGESGSTRRTGIRAMGFALIALALAAAGFVWLRKAPALGSNSRPRTLAILPFQNLRRDAADDFLGFSLADAIITKLDYVRSLTVRPSSAVEKYRGKQLDTHAIAADLHVNTLLTGNFIRDGEDLRITWQLIDVGSQNILWKGSFDVKYANLLTVHNNVAQQMIKGLELSLTPVEAERLKPDKLINPVAYEYYLRGVDLYARNDFPVAIKMLEKSAEVDPTYALTWAHLGRSHTANASFEMAGREEYDAAQAAYEKALAIEPAQTEAQIFMANRFTDTGRVENAVPVLRNVLRTTPNNAEAHWELSYAYRFAGMLEESRWEAERARQFDPDVKISTSTINAYLYLGKYEAFLRSLPKIDDSVLIRFYRGFGYYHQKYWDRAAREFDAAFQSHPSLLQARVGKALSYAITRRNTEGLKILHDTEEKISERGVGDPEAIYKISQAYAVLGDKGSALRVLRRSIEMGFFPYPYFAKDPLLQALRSEGEFTRLLTLARERHESFRRAFF